MNIIRISIPYLTSKSCGLIMLDVFAPSFLQKKVSNLFDGDWKPFCRFMKWPWNEDATMMWS